MFSKYLQKIRLVISHFLLYSATIIYTIFGAVIFHRLELPFEIEHLEKHSKDVFEAQGSFLTKIFLVIFLLFLVDIFFKKALCEIIFLEIIRNN